MTYFSKLSSKQLVICAGICSGALLGAAFVFQSLGYAPCKLCLWQRWPHAIALGIAALAWCLNADNMPKIPIWIGALSLLTTSALGAYHSGVERQLWEGPSSCTGGGIQGLSVDDLMAQINAAPLIRCDEIAWELLGLTMANLNAIGSLALAGVWIWAALKK